MAETSPPRRRMIEDMTVRNISPAMELSTSTEPGAAIGAEKGPL
jgi:hypothetical protein